MPPCGWKEYYTLRSLAEERAGDKVHDVIHEFFFFNLGFN